MRLSEEVTLAVALVWRSGVHKHLVKQPASRHFYLVNPDGLIITL